MSEQFQYRDPILHNNHNTPTDEIDTLGFYEREFYPFSNFSSFQVEWSGALWPTSEHAYQAARYFGTRPNYVRAILGMKSAHEAFMFMRDNRVDQRPDWENTKRNTMKDIVRHKLGQHGYIQAKLLQTGECQLIEDSPVDSYWGWGADRQGRNELGKIWMELREELKNGNIK